MPRIKRPARILLCVLLGLATLRALLPIVIQSYVNHTLDRASDYDGRVGDVDLFLLAGAYSIEDIEIVQTSGRVEQPLFSTPRLEFSLLWSALLDGALVGEVELLRPVINFADGPAASDRQTGAGEPWLNIASDLFPLRIDRLAIVDGTVAFYNAGAEPPIHVSLDAIDLLALNIVNSRNLATAMEARVRATASVAGGGHLLLEGSLNPDSTRPTFDIDFEASDVGLADFENLLNYYAPFDLEAGSLDLAVELASDDGELTGYVRPVLRNIDVFSWKGDIEEDEDGPFKALAELFAGGLAELFENQPTDQFATEVPVSGTLDDPDTGTVAALFAILRNAFVEALKAEVDNSIELEDN